MKHTPGPWRISGTMTKYIEASLGNGWTQEIATVGPTEHDNGYGEQHRANARLIAAAPDLLEAMELIANTGMDAKQCRDTARAAIAKATGEQQ
jgi:hypothetical protein